MFCDDLSLAAILSKAGRREEAANTVRVDGNFVLLWLPDSPHEASTRSAATANAFLITGEILSPTWSTPCPCGPTLLPASSHPRPADRSTTLLRRLHIHNPACSSPFVCSAR